VLSLEHAALRFFERTAAEQPPTAESLEAAALARRAADRGWAGEEGLLPVWELAAALTKLVLMISFEMFHDTTRPHVVQYEPRFRFRPKIN